MRRVAVALMLAMALILGLAAAPTMAGSKNQPVGARISLLAEPIGDDQSFDPSTAFHINHGFCLEDTVINRAIGRYSFRLDVDGTPRNADFFQVSQPDGCQLLKFWYFNFPAGLTGSHDFTGHWLVPCDNDAVPCNGAKMHTAVEVDTLTITVTFP